MISLTLFPFKLCLLVARHSTNTYVAKSVGHSLEFCSFREHLRACFEHGPYPPRGPTGNLFEMSGYPSDFILTGFGSLSLKSTFISDDLQQINSIVSKFNKSNHKCSSCYLIFPYRFTFMDLNVWKDFLGRNLIFCGDLLRPSAA